MRLVQCDMRAGHAATGQCGLGLCHSQWTEARESAESWATEQRVTSDHNNHGPWQHNSLVVIISRMKWHPDNFTLTKMTSFSEKETTKRKQQRSEDERVILSWQRRSCFSDSHADIITKWRFRKYALGSHYSRDSDIIETWVNPTTWIVLWKSGARCNTFLETTHCNFHFSDEC